MARQRKTRTLDESQTKALILLVSKMCELRTIADHERFDMLAYLLDMAIAEADYIERLGRLP